MMVELPNNTEIATPLHAQKMEQALSLEPLLHYVSDLMNPQLSDLETDTDAEADVDLDQRPVFDASNSQHFNGIVTTRAERRTDKSRLYNFGKVKKSRKWLKNILLSDSSSDEDDDQPLTDDDLKDMLRRHKFQRQCQAQFHKDKELLQYQYYSTGLLSTYDKFYEHQKMIVGPKKKLAKEQKKLDKKKAKLKRLKEKNQTPFELEDGELKMIKSESQPRPVKIRKLTPEQIAIKRRKIMVSIAKKEVPKAQKQKASARKEMMTLLKKVAKDCQKECRRSAMQSQKIMKDTPTRARRLSKEMLAYWKRFEKVEKEHRRRAEKEAIEQRKMDHELKEMKRQQRKLNFLITQTELYAHFMARKIHGEKDREDHEQTSILRRLDDGPPGGANAEAQGRVLTDVIGDDYDSDETKARALRNAENAFNTHYAKKEAFDARVAHVRGGEGSLSNPSISTQPDQPQPMLFEGKLKGYQLKGMNWLANLYNQGINGILADEMGLGKTVQTIAFLAHLSETQNIWGPFLVVAPASTLHNWQQEVSRFVSKFKVVPYWGNTQDRKILRKFWNPEQLHTPGASFHVVITSYQLVIQDVKYFQRINWQYMVLDEAQALKSTSSVRWKILLGFNCRNRLLLTGTPIQNSMAELWALLHFIMPTLFDSHDEFNEWFSKDIESHAEKQSGIDEEQLSRLHMILKPFMLRRVKKDVENELSDKIEILVYCPLVKRQRMLYQAVKNKISIEDLLQSASNNTSLAQTSTSSLMNLVMQFRKVCNHPELFERREVRGPIYIATEPYRIPKLVYREGILQGSLPSKDHLVYNLLCVFTASHIHQSLQDGGGLFSFLPFINMTPGELHKIMMAGLLVRWLAVLAFLKQAPVVHHRVEWREKSQEKKFDSTSFLLQPCRTTYFANVSSSPNLRRLIFTSYTRTVYTHLSHTIHSMPETIAHRKIRLRPLTAKSSVSVAARTLTSPPLSPTKSPGKSGGKSIHSPTKKAAIQVVSEPEPAWMTQVHRHIPRPSHVLDMKPTDMPSFLYHNFPRLVMKPLDSYTSDRSAAWQHVRETLCGSREAYQSLLYGNQEMAQRARYTRGTFVAAPCGGLLGIEPKYGYSGVDVPNKEMLVTDAGKLSVLDTLLARLKKDGHRVLIYSQMTRMIDILEEYMWHRKHTYMRLDGSSKISDRRDMVADFQARSDIFVFLLSTRAGGLGINLTAADTVIFYDSDWNPTVDQQAMDRAHRLGQTKQVTVYRLICKGSIEERILQRAKEKSEIQRMVISGGSFRPDVLKPKEVVSLLLDDDEMERKLRQKQGEKVSKEEENKEKLRKRKREKYAAEKNPFGRGPGRPRKKRAEDVNVTIPAPSPADAGDSLWSLDSMTSAASPASVKSFGSLGIGDESSNDGLVIVDDPNSMSAASPTTSTSSSAPPPPKRGGRPRGRPRGSGVGRRPAGRGSLRKAIAAAELAGAEAGKTAAYAAYGYTLAGPATKASTPPTTPTRGKPSPRGFYTPRTSTP